MTRYQATIRHYSISSARIVDVGNNLTAAKRAATKEFGGDFNDYVLVILDSTIPEHFDFGDRIVASKRLGAKRWPCKTAAEDKLGDEGKGIVKVMSNFQELRQEARLNRRAADVTLRALERAFADYEAAIDGADNGMANEACNSYNELSAQLDELNVRGRDIATAAARLKSVGAHGVYSGYNGLYR